MCAADGFLRSANPLRGHRLEPVFQNGGTSVVNMKRRVKTLRFSRLADEIVFASAKTVGGKVVWIDGKAAFSVCCGELLDAMMD